MSLDNETVKNIANLARIKVGDDKLYHLAGELSAILSWVEQLNAVDTEGVEPLASVVDVTLPLRTDVVSDGDCRDKVLANAPEVEDGFYAVPKVVE
ncbi:MAG: Asp-tRNA(Asn)/Glu-tRNA(Gln) amidotransferase subunit GatC [Rhodospirillaceae bacterium]|nr:Asp-tRNA(Asn)/Glu-tRNA(Gln) amidotransferase subunit GatC [Rhodospirillaceae bacterium]MBL6942439.1 Asp-tRNA(Asn)/Glu-tRNA(Gln) amidotransferase subunit GatC [Rhodospirillales bacterium]